MNQITRPPARRMTTDEFLAWPGDGRKYQLVDGEVRVAAPASSVHSIIQARLALLLGRSCEAAGLPLNVLTEGALIPGVDAAKNVRVPDVVLAAAEGERGQQTAKDPLLVVEVLSPGNGDDTRGNIRACATLASVREMALVHSTRVLAEVHRRDGAGAWLPEPKHVGPGERLRFATAALDCAIEDAYRGTWLVRAARA